MAHRHSFSMVYGIFLDQGSILCPLHGQVIYLVFLPVLDLLCCTGFSLVVANRGYSLVAECGLWGSRASVVMMHRLSCSTATKGSLIPSQIRITPVSPALTGRFFTTEPTGKPSSDIPSERISEMKVGAPHCYHHILLLFSS